MSPEIREIQPDPLLPDVISAPRDLLLRGLLERKRAEYEERLSEQRRVNPEMDAAHAESYRDRMKLHILEAVLAKGRARTDWLYSKFTQRHGALAGIVGLEEFMSAWNSAILVIDDYCTTGGPNIQGGTGLRVEDLQISIPLTPISREEWARMAGRVSSDSVDTQSTPTETTQTTPPIPE